jgi:anthranilate synthase component 1
MAAGLFGYLGYDMVRAMERLAPARPSPVDEPDAILVRPQIVVVFDSLKDEIAIVRTVRPAAPGPGPEAFEAARDAVEATMAHLDAPLAGSDMRHPGPAELPAPVSNLAPGRYEAMVARAKEYILAGDIFQVVLSQRYEAPFPLPASQLYRALRRTNPAPFLCFLDFERFQIVCSSPEILVRVRDGRVTVRPIAGTRPRGATPEADRRLAEELLADPKERAEHLMLLDLGRNDVEGDLRPDRDALDALAAGFPAGTVSGAPKVRAMQIIDELEPDGRGPYAGCIGYFGADGQMDSCIVLRTAVVKDGRMVVQAGAGIVHDSDPVSEALECENKAKALFRAAAEAMRLATEPRRGQ